MVNRENIQSEVAHIKQLRTNYDRLVIEPNSHDTIEAYHKWHEKSCVVFSHYFDETCKEYVNFIGVNNNANGYGLNRNYQKIRKDFCVLVDKLEHGDFGTQKHDMVEATPITKTSSKKRIFISHASKDEELISKFVDSIFLLGLELDSEIIAYTSREDTGVPAGESIPQFIQDNIACAEIVLLMISDNYKKSEVCMNEMGAAWALNKHIIQILLPNTSFDKLGWLCSLDKAIKINNPDNLDGLCEVFADILDISVKPSVWNRNKKSFISYCTASLTTSIESDVIEVDNNNDDELGFLDYVELLEKDSESVSTICSILTEALVKHNDVLHYNSKRLSKINPSKVKGVIQIIAKEMDDLSIIFEKNTPLLHSSFFSMIDNATKMESLVVSDNEENMQKEYDAIGELLKSISEVKQASVGFKNSIDSLPKVEKIINTAKKQLSNNLANLISTFDDCIAKSQELLRCIL